MKELLVFSPATVSNIGPGFDLMGFALNDPGDILHIRKNGKNEIRLFNNTEFDLPEDPDKNVAGVAVKALLHDLENLEGFDITFEQKIKPGSGIGSSAASCTAAVFGVNEILGKPLNKKQLIEYALKGEYLASRSIHADNIAPAMLGGIVLIRQYNPIDLINLNAPAELWCTIAHPDIVIKTSESRQLIPGEIPLPDVLAQCGNIASLVAGITTSNYDLIFRSIEDRIAEPFRKKSIPAYEPLKSLLKDEGIIAFNISGSGPSVFALTNSEGMADRAADLMGTTFIEKGITCNTYTSKISEPGTRILEN